jgi:hypothetical protein
VTSAAAGVGRATTAATTATAATAAIAVKSPTAALRSSLKASRQRASSTQQQQSGEGDLASAVPRKRVRFSGVACSQQDEAGAAGAAAMVATGMEEVLQQRSGQPGATSQPQQPAEVQPRDKPDVISQQEQPQPGVPSYLKECPGSQAAWGKRQQQQQQQQATPAIPIVAAAVPGAPAACAATREGRDSSKCKGNENTNACSSSSRTSRFFAGNSSNSSDRPGQPRLQPETRITAAAVAGTAAAAVNPAKPAAAVLTLEELAYSMPGLLTPGSVSRQQLQEGTVIAQVGQVCLAQWITFVLCNMGDRAICPKTEPPSHKLRMPHVHMPHATVLGLHLARFC